MRKLYSLILLAFSINTLHSQTILFEENFESFSDSFSLNTIDLGGASFGKNLWVVNNSYFGGDVNVFCPFPTSVPLSATPDQPIAITSSPQSHYLHITSQDGLNSSVDNCHFAAADFFGCTPSENYFARISSSISTVGQSNVEVSFWWLCSGASGVAYGEVYYSTDNGLTWSTLGIINEYANQSNWIQTTIQNSVLDNQASLMIGFNFVNTSNFFASPTDPAFGIDDFQISSSPSTINTINTDPILLGPYCPGQPISVPFSASGTYSSSNVYSAQLSDSFGLFTSPISIGSLNGSATLGVINAIIPLGTTPGTLYQIRVVASDPNTIGSPSPVNIEVAGSPTASISLDSDSSICAGGVALLFFEGSAGEIQWSSSTDNVNFTPIPGANNATLTTDPITQTTYFLVAVTNNCGTTTSQSWAVTSTSIVNIPVIYSPAALNLCNGPITVSVAGNFFDLVWSNQQAGTAVIVVSSASTVSVVGTDIDGCPAASNPLVFFETTPAALSISPAGPITICSDPVTLSASSGFDTYTWSDGDVGMSNSVSTPGSYSVTATDAQGCIVSSSLVIVQTESSTASISPNSYSSICVGGVAFLFFEGSAGEIQWSSSTDNVNFTPIPGANNATLTTNSITQTTYFLVAVTNNCGTTTSQSWAVTLTSIVNIPVTYSPDALNLCNGPITVSVVGDFFDLVWSNQQAGTAVIVVSSASTVSVVGTDIDGCPAASNPLVFFETTPAALTISPAGPITICSDPAILSASFGFNTYTWSDGDVGMSNSVSTSGSYSVTATDGQGCIVSSSPVIVQTGSSVDIPVSPSISAICDNVPATLTADVGFFNYTWSNGAIGQEITVSLPGFYSVTGTDVNGCPGESALVEVIQAQFPVANFTYTQTSGYAIAFDNSSQNGLEYEWIFEDLGSSPLANPTFTFPDSGPYQITLITSNPCSSDTITKIIIVTYVGIQDLDESTHFSVSPNPSSDDFIIAQHGTSSSISGLTLRDISGRVVYQNAQEIKALSNFILPASNLPAGMYFLHFETLNGTVNIRVLKK